MLRVGDWLVDAEADTLHGQDKVVKLEPRVMRLLLALARRAGEVVPLSVLLDEVWHDVVVTPESVYQGIAALRRALDEAGSGSAYIASVPRKGYRLVAPVSEPAPEPVSATAEPPPARGPLGRAASALASRRWSVAVAGVAVAVVSLVLPAARAPSPPPGQPAGAADTGPLAPGAAPDGPHRVLWVDDRPGENERERDALQPFDIRFTLALSTDEALDRLRDERFDLIISDMSRPGDERAGYTLLARLRERGDTTHYVIYTGSCTDQQLLEARGRGALACTRKISELMQAVIGAFEAGH